jgi:hypothetical protein
MQGSSFTELLFEQRSLGQKQRSRPSGVFLIGLISTTTALKSSGTRDDGALPATGDAAVGSESDVAAVACVID